MNASCLLKIGEISLGSVAIPLDQVLGALTGSDVQESWRNIIVAFRLPHAINAAASGAALGVAGLLL